MLRSPSALPAGAVYAAAPLVALLLASPAAAQIVGGEWATPVSFPGHAADNHAGRALDFVGDLDGDGLPDLIISEDDASPNGLNMAGSVYVRSSADGSDLWVFHGESANASFGTSVAGLEDINGDGVADILIGAPYEDPGGRKGAGSVYAYSGADGSLLLRADGVKPGDQLGYSVAAIADTNGDGADELVLGAHGAWDGAINGAGKIYLLSGIDGAVLQRQYGANPGAHLGYGVSRAGDMNGDGVEDYAGGAWGFDNAGKKNAGAVYAYSGADGSLIWEHLGPRERAFRGETLAAGGDIDADGVPDLVSGSPRAIGEPFSINAGAVVAHSGVDGSVIHEIRGSIDEDVLGRTVTGLGDLNADRHAEFVAGSPGHDPNHIHHGGTAFIYDGASGALLHRFDGNIHHASLAFTVRGGEDITGDGAPDLVMSQPGAQVSGVGGDTGRALIMSFQPWLVLSGLDLSAAAGGTIDFAIDFPASEAGANYGLLFSGAGRGPSVLKGLTVPLEQDPVFFNTRLGNYPSTLSGERGVLDVNGDASATLAAGPGDLANFAGRRFWVCAISWDTGGPLRLSSAGSLMIINP